MSVEFALISIILFTLLFAIIEFGLFFSRYQVYASAAREGARVAATRGTEDQIRDAVERGAQPYDDLIPSSIHIETCDDGNVGQAVEVSWTQDFSDTIVLPFIPDITVDVPIKAVFRCE